MMNFPGMKFLLIIFAILGIHFAFAVAEAENESGEQNSEEYENALVQNLRNDYSNGFIGIMTYFQTLNRTIAVLTEKMVNMETSARSNFQAIQADFTAQNVKLDATRTVANSNHQILTAKIDNLRRELVELKTITNNNNAGVTTKLVSTAKYLSLWLPSLSRSLSWAEFDNIIEVKPAVQIGKSFNESDSSTIKSRVLASAGANREYTVVVFVNHLDKAITDFKIYNENSVTTYNPAPNSIPPHTKEIFTFADPQQTCRHITFSYAIPASDVRIAALSRDAGDDEGLAFVHKNTDMKSYWDSKQGIAGSSVYEQADWVDRKLSVGYQNYYARMFMDSEGDRRGTLHIELIELP